MCNPLPFTRSVSAYLLIAAVGLIRILPPALGQEPSTTTAAREWPLLQVPEKGIPELQNFVNKVRMLRPSTPQQYLEMQRMIREASLRLLDHLPDRESADSKRAEFDYISSSVMLLGNDGEESQRKTYEKFRDYLQKKEELNFNDIQIAILCGQNLEQFDDNSLAKEAYLAFSEILESKKNPAFSEVIDLLKASHRRLSLLGIPIELKGKTSRGNELDVGTYRGKYVLIYVWATWSPPCLEEYSHLVKIYESYREKGFEIIGISLDDSLQQVQDFEKKMRVPWSNLWDGKISRSHPFVKEHGIASLPTSILLEPSGKVVALEAGSKALAIALDKLLQRPLQTNAPPPPNQKPGVSANSNNLNPGR